jgi:hypothetical protein
MKSKEIKKIVVYTCITGNYDELISPIEFEKDIDYVCLTDKSIIYANGWQTRPISFSSGNAAAANRYAKMHPHILFKDYEISIYLDGNIEIIGGLKDLIKNALAVNDIAMYEHPFRDCIYQEADECSAIGYDWFWRFKRQMNEYKKNGYPFKAGLFECNVIIRRHNNKEIQRLMNSWWDEYQCGVKRDQISLPFLVWRLGVCIMNLGKSDHRFEKKHFSIKIGHRQSNKLSNRIRGFINRFLNHHEGISL